MSNARETKDDDISATRTKEEESIAKSLLKVFQRRQEELKAQHGSTGGMNETEVQILKNLQTLELTYSGLAVSLATFWILRGIRFNTRKWMVQRTQQKNSTGFSTDGGKTFSPFHNSPPGQEPAPIVIPPETPLARWFGVFLDATVGALVGTLFDEYLVDRDAAKKTFAEIPLQPGRSNIAEQLCPVLIQEHQRQWNLAKTRSTTNQQDAYKEEGTLGSISIQPNPRDQLNPKEIFNNPKTEHLKLLTQFIRNCQKRQAMEQQIRKQQGLQDNVPVEIPDPGVPVDQNTTSDTSGGSDDPSFEKSFYEGETVVDTSNQDWNEEDISSFVADQEDESNRRG